MDIGNGDHGCNGMLARKHAKVVYRKEYVTINVLDLSMVENLVHRKFQRRIHFIEVATKIYLVLVSNCNKKNKKKQKLATATENRYLI